MSETFRLTDLSHLARFNTTENLMMSRRLSVQYFYQLEVKNQMFFVESEFEAFLDQSETKLEDSNYCKKLTQCAIESIEFNDNIISLNLKNWKIDRLSKVDLSVLRVSVAEISFRTDVSPKVIIADAVEIAKLFGSQNSGAFVNGVLDKVSKELQTKQKK
jgi:transcription antitermination protein NusB